MAPWRNPRQLAAVLAVGLAWAFPLSGRVLAQRFGPPISSGSGAGTGTGAEAGSGLGTTGTGTEAGYGFGSTGTGFESSASTNPAYPVFRFGPGYRSIGPARPGGRSAPFMPGAIDPGATENNRSPDDILPPADSGFGGGDARSLDPEAVAELYFQAIIRARTFDEPGERATALERVARSAIFTGHFDEAHTALIEAREAAVLEREPLVHEQRLISIVTSILSLAEALVREGMADEAVAPETTTPSPEQNAAAGAPKTDQTPRNEPPKPPPAPSGRRLNDRIVWLENAQNEWASAAELCMQLRNVNFRTQYLYRVVDSQGGGSQMIANQVLRASASNSNLVSQAGPLNGIADRFLLIAATHARMIERPVWRDRALVAVAANAASSNQFRRGLQIAKSVPQPEVRTDGLLRIAEAQARRGFHDEATVSYQEAARAVASIPQTDPRVILAGVLIDSLVSVGRFDDARESIIFYPDYSHQILALGAIAEAQGSRGQADAARVWISREAPAEYRPYLNRRVYDGVLAAVDKNRSSELSTQGYFRGTER